ncbi:hypothetical protein L596_021035 [Steinernema carpocapsae]|uniref:Uncharacterized protein n=1 Tax=Steinernema carpocapsae TaxID=34508 RepID=A0A4U5MVC3_STECR|nr:hypothetical protein L596_021035 [Steinernema carpocapsae]
MKSQNKRNGGGHYFGLCFGDNSIEVCSIKVTKTFSAVGKIFIGCLKHVLRRRLITQWLVITRILAKFNFKSFF